MFHFISILLISFHAYSFQSGFESGFQLSSHHKLPQEFKLLFESLKGQISQEEKISQDEEKRKLIQQCFTLSENLKMIDKDQVFLFVKTQIIRHILEAKYSKINTIALSAGFIKKLEESYEQKKTELHSFSRWIWNSILSELKDKRDQIKGDKTKLQYLSGWLSSMENLSALDFNLMVNKLSWNVLEKMIERSQLLRFGHEQSSDSAHNSHDTKNFFVIPAELRQKYLHVSTNILHSDSPPDDLEENRLINLKKASEAAKESAKTKMEQISADDLSPLSDEIMKEIEEKLP